MSYSVLLDPESDALNAYLVDSYPRNFFINTLGRIMNVVKGGLNYSQLQGYVSPLLIGYDTRTPTP